MSRLRFFVFLSLSTFILSCKPAAFTSDSSSVTILNVTTTTTSGGTTTTLPGGVTTTTVTGTTSTTLPGGGMTTTTIHAVTTTTLISTTTTHVVTTTTLQTRSVTTTKVVTAQDNQLDVALVIDDSNSMLKDNQKLAQRLQGFVSDLSLAGFDWQMCVTVTNAQQLSVDDPTLYWGASRYWAGAGGATPYILKANSGNISQIFQDTINQIGAGWAGTDDERGIKAAWWHLWNGDLRYAYASGCYRQEAGLATVVISDEDERSVGGDPSQEYYPGEFKPLELDDYPTQYKALVQDVFGATKRATFNSIIVKPGDSTCMAVQDAEGSKSHFGTKYNELSLLLGGGIGSICDTDYSSSLQYFKNQIVNTMASLPLECAPVGPVTVTIDPAFSTTTSVQGTTLYFNPKVPAGRTIHASYQCPF